MRYNAAIMVHALMLLVASSLRLNLECSPNMFISYFVILPH